MNLTRPKKNIDLRNEAKKSKWVVDAFLAKNYRILPSIFNDAENLLPEEKSFIFWLDAYWGQKSSSIQAIEIILSEAMDTAREKIELPTGLRIALSDALEKAETESQKNSIRSAMLDAPIRHRQMQIAKILDMLDAYVSPDESAKLKAEYTEKTNSILRKSNGQ